MKTQPFPSFLSKLHSRAGLAAAIVSILAGSAASISAANLTWTNSPNTGNWNTADANWSGNATWNNSTPDNAIFSNANQTVTLTENITGGSLLFQAGGNPSGAHLLTLTGNSSLSLATITVNGIGLGGNVDSLTDSANQRLKLNNISATASGDVSVTRGSMEVSGTTALNITGKLLATGDWSNFVMGPGTSVTVTGGVDFYNGKAATNLDLNGGTLTTAYIYGNKFINALPERNTNVNFNGTTVVATVDNADFLQVHAAGHAVNRDVASIRTGGLIFDTNGHAVTIANVLANYTGETGTLTKNGTGTLTLSSANTYNGTTTINGGTLALAGGSAIVDTGAVVLADISGAGLQLNASETIGSLSGGGSSGGNVNLQANTLTVGNAGTTTYAGVVSGSGSLTKNGTGNLILSGANTYGGTTTVNAGTLTLSGARTVASGAIAVASASGTNATLAIQNGTYALGANNFQVGNNANATGTVNQSGGAVTFTSGSELLIGAAGTGAAGVYNLSGGSLSVANGSFNLGVLLGVNTGVQGGTFNLSGSGNLTVGSGSRLFIGRSDDAGNANNTTNLFNQTGGTASISTLAMGGKTGGSTGVSSTLTLTGGTFSASAFSVLAAGNTNTAVINIGGAADVTLPALPTARGTSSTATLNFDGGTLRPFAASSNFIGGLTNAFIKAGGANIDVASGKDITITQNLLTDVVSTGGGLTKAGVGALTLSGTNTYTGSTTVTAGTLVLASTGSIASSQLISVQSGATLDVSAVAGGFQLQSGQTLQNKGTFTGGLTALSGSTYAPGNSPGLATQVGALALNTGSTFEWELVANSTASPGTNFDQTVFTSGGLTIQSGVTANLVFNYSGSSVVWANSFWDTDQSWTLFSGASSLSSVAGVFGTTNVGVDSLGQTLSAGRGSFSFTTSGNDVLLNYTAVPEPATWGLLAFSLTAVLTLRRRRQS